MDLNDLTGCRFYSRRTEAFVTVIRDHSNIVRVSVNDGKVLQLMNTDKSLFVQMVDKGQLLYFTRRNI